MLLFAPLKMRWLVLLFAAGCLGDQPTLQVHITDELGTAIEGATVAAVCDVPGNGDADYTDTAGIADLVFWYESGETPCTVTVSRDGFATLQVTGIPACPAENTCAAVELALEAL
jgi:hypothetical protein